MSGRKLAAKLRGEMKPRLEALAALGVTPGLAVILVGQNPASMIYVRDKAKACAKAGVYSEQHDLPEDCTQQTLLGLIDRLNRDPKIHGILVQLPLPAHLDENAVWPPLPRKRTWTLFIWRT
jgi:methylenetetrahydrofolate dehydrogenase (NADP+)/methenyltetrahydrofolate cyclohydrolase